MSPILLKASPWTNSPCCDIDRKLNRLRYSVAGATKDAVGRLKCIHLRRCSPCWQRSWGTKMVSISIRATLSLNLTCFGWTLGRKTSWSNHFARFGPLALLAPWESGQRFVAPPRRRGKLQKISIISHPQSDPHPNGLVWRITGFLFNEKNVETAALDNPPII